MKKNLIFIIPAKVSGNLDKKNFIKYKKKYLLEHKINSLLSTKLGPVFVISNFKKIIKISTANNAQGIFVENSKKLKNGSMLYSITAGLNEIINEGYKIDYVAVAPIQNLFLKKNSIVKACKKIISTQKANSLNAFLQVSEYHPCQIVDQKNNFMKFDIIKFKNTIFSKTEKTKDLPTANYASCALRISKFKYLNQLMKKKRYNKFIVDIKSCLGFEISNKEAFEIKNAKDLKYAKYLYKYVR